MTPTLDELKRRITCTVCGKVFKYTPFELPIVGMPNGASAKLAQNLGAHISTHKEEAMNFALLLNEAGEYGALALFEFDDPKLMERYERIRANLHRFTRKFRISDAEIADRVARLQEAGELDESQVEPFRALLRDMRDMLQEQGRYEPKKYEPSLVTA